MGGNIATHGLIPLAEMNDMRYCSFRRKVIRARVTHSR